MAGDHKKSYKNRSSRRRRALAESLAGRDGGWHCTYCGTDVSKDYQIDHVWPLIRADEYPGDINGLDNLALACRGCNRAKGSMTLEEWIERL